MDRITRGDRTLRVAGESHLAKHAGHWLFWGNNFVECLICGEHCHLHTNPDKVVRHNSDYTILETIDPEQF